MKQVTLNDIKCCRWSGANEPEPAYIKDGIPYPLIYFQAKHLLAEVTDKVAELERENAELRELLGKIINYKMTPDTWNRAEALVAGKGGKGK